MTIRKSEEFSGAQKLIKAYVKQEKPLRRFHTVIKMWGEFNIFGPLIFLYCLVILVGGAWLEPATPVYKRFF